jgi:hypothetical protein
VGSAMVSPRTEVFGEPRCLAPGKGGGGVCGGDRRAWTTHIGTGYADLEACRTGWTARRRDDPDACRSGVPAVRRSIWRPERLKSAVRSWGPARLALTAPPIRRLYELMLGQNMGITALSCAHRVENAPRVTHCPADPLSVPPRTTRPPARRMPGLCGMRSSARHSRDPLSSGQRRSSPRCSVTIRGCACWSAVFQSRLDSICTDPEHPDS